MRRTFVCLVVLLLAARAGADQPKGRLLLDHWYAAYLNGAKAGFVHTTVREFGSGTKILRTVNELDLRVKRFKDDVRMFMQTGTDETPAGKVTGVFMRQGLAEGQQLVLTGTVDDEQLHVKVTGLANPMDKKIWWNDQVIGLYGEMNLFRNKKVKPGDTFSYMHYEPSLNAVVTVKVTVKDFEEIDNNGRKLKLLRVESRPDKILGVQLPASSLWLNKDLDVVRSQVEMEGLGKLVLVQTSKEEAQRRDGPTAKLPDIGLTNLIRLNRRIEDPHETDSVTYRITLPNDDEPATAFVRDSRQKVARAKGKSFELTIQAIRKPDPDTDGGEDNVAEYLKSNDFINSKDAKVREFAAEAVGREKDPWRKAQRIERWVHDHMRVVNFSVAMATADHVARTLEGDCSEFAMLTAAMCRAAGVPARIAVGLVYAENKGMPTLAYHMWTEVCVAGQWLALDATLGRGSVGACHLKITHHSWNDTQSIAPLLPLTRVMLGKPAIEVIRTGAED